MPNNKKRPRLPGGDLELAILASLWERGAAATARELHEEVGVPRGIVYTTVAKVLDRLAEKHMVRRRRVGRAYSYVASVTRENTQRALVRTVIEQVSGGGVRPAVAALLGALEDVSPALLDQLEAELKERRSSEDGA